MMAPNREKTYFQTGHRSLGGNLSETESDSVLTGWVGEKRVDFHSHVAPDVDCLLSALIDISAKAQPHLRTRKNWMPGADLTRCLVFKGEGVQKSNIALQTMLGTSEERPNLVGLEVPADKAKRQESSSVASSQPPSANNGSPNLASKQIPSG